MPYYYTAESFHTKKLFGRLLREKPIFGIRKTATLRFETHLGACRATFAVNLMLTGKLAVDFLVIIELFSLGTSLSHNARV